MDDTYRAPKFKNYEIYSHISNRELSKIKSQHKYDVFISFPEEAKDIAEQFRLQIEVARLTTFMYCHNLTWGDILWREIESALDNSLTVLAILTKESVDSYGVAREIDRALFRQKRIYPLFDRYTQPIEHHPISQIYWRRLEDNDIPTLAQEIINNIYEIKRNASLGILALAVGAAGMIYLATRK